MSKKYRYYRQHSIKKRKTKHNRQYVIQCRDRQFPSIGWYSEGTYKTEKAAKQALAHMKSRHIRSELNWRKNLLDIFRHRKNRGITLQFLRGVFKSPLIEDDYRIVKRH